MGFPSPAKDYEENRIDWNEIMVPRPAATLFVPTDDGFVLIDKSIKPKVNDIIYFEAFGIYELGRLGRDYIICQSGDTFEGEAMKDIVVIGVQTWGIISVHEDNRPTI